MDKLGRLNLDVDVKANTCGKIKFFESNEEVDLQLEKGKRMLTTESTTGQGNIVIVRDGMYVSNIVRICNPHKARMPMGLIKPQDAESAVAALTEASDLNDVAVILADFLGEEYLTTSKPEGNVAIIPTPGKLQNRSTSLGAYELILQILKISKRPHARIKQESIDSGDTFKHTAGRSVTEYDPYKVMKKLSRKFEVDVLPKNHNVDRYVLFLFVISKILDKLEPSQERSILASYMLDNFIRMYYEFTPVEPSQDDILKLLSLIIRVIDEAGNYSYYGYKIDQPVMEILVQWAEEFYIEKEDPMRTLVNDMSRILNTLKIPVDNYRIDNIMRHVIQLAALKQSSTQKEARITYLIEKIVTSQDDPSALSHYALLQLFLERDNYAKGFAAKIVGSMRNNKHRRFIDNLLNDLAVGNA